MNEEPTDLYRLFDIGARLLYVGISLSIAQRMGQHRAEKPWWDQVRSIGVEHYATRAEAREAELLAIQTEDPLYNIDGIVPYSTLRFRFSDGQAFDLRVRDDRLRCWQDAAYRSGMDLKEWLSAVANAAVAEAAGHH